MFSKTATTTMFVFLSAVAGALGEESVRYFEKDGVTYRESRQVVRRPLTETKLQSQQRIVYREKVVTEYRTIERTVQVPVTEHRWVPYWEGTWNPFSPPYQTYRWAPTVRWETKKEQVRIPVARRELQPEVQTHLVPVTSNRCVEDETVVRTAISFKPSAPTSLGSPTPATTNNVADADRPSGDPFAQGDDSPSTDDSRSTSEELSPLENLPPGPTRYGNRRPDEDATRR